MALQEFLEYLGCITLFNQESASDAPHTLGIHMFLLHILIFMLICKYLHYEEFLIFCELLLIHLNSSAPSEIISIRCAQYIRPKKNRTSTKQCHNARWNILMFHVFMGKKYIAFKVKALENGGQKQTKNFKIMWLQCQGSLA